MLRRWIGPLALVVAVAVVSWLLSGVALLDIVKFVAYDAGFVALPGALLLWALRGRRSHFLVTIAVGWPLGHSLEVLAFTATAAIGLRGLFLLYPVVVAVPSALVIYGHRRDVEQDPDGEALSVGSMWAGAAFLSLGLIYLALMFLPQAPLPSSAVSVEYTDFPYFLGLITQVTHHWPPTIPGLYGVALPYEWFVFFHMAAASQVTHLSIPVIALRLDYIPTILVVGCQLLAAGRYFGRAAWTGAIAIGVIFVLGPLDLVASANGTPFGDNVLVHLWDSWTFPFGLMFFLALLYAISERLRADTQRTPGDLRSWVVIALLMIGASGAKATVLPVIIAGTALYALMRVVIWRKVPTAAIVTTGMGVVIFAVTYLVIYAGAAPDTVIKPLTWLSGTPPVLFVDGIHHAIVREVLLPFAYVASLAGLLLPLAGMLYPLRRRHRHRFSTFLLPFCMLVGGAFITSVVHQSSYSELYFEDMGYVAGAIVAAEGLRLAWLDLGRAIPVTRRAALIALAISVALLMIVIKLTSHQIATPGSTTKLYVGLALAGLVLTVVWAVVRSARDGRASGAIAVGLIPLVAAAVLTSPLIVYPTIRKTLSGIPVTSPKPVLTPGVLTALRWLRDHSSVDTVFAVNNHWLDPARGNGKYYYYTAFSERQIFIEAYDPIRFGVTPGIASPTAATFAYRQGLNDAVFRHADPNALRIMTQDYPVRFLFIDRRLGDQDPAVLQLGHVVFSNQDAVIVAVR